MYIYIYIYVLYIICKERACMDIKTKKAQKRTIKLYEPTNSI